MNRLCELCGIRLAEHKHHALSDTKKNRELYGDLLDNNLNIYFLCSICHLNKSIPKDDELLFCTKLKIKPRSKNLLSKINNKKITPFEEVTEMNITGSRDGKVFFIDDDKVMVDGKMYYEKDTQNLPKADAYSMLADVRAIVEEMVYPIQYLENEAKKQGGVLNGVMAVQISNDVEFYKSRSRIILQKISEHFS